MNRRRIVATILLMIFILCSVLPTINGYAATTDGITLDSALYTAVKDNLTKQGIQASYNDMQNTITISANEIAKVTKLTLSNSSITNLNGLENFSNVNYLDLSSNDLTDESDLAILNSLKLSFLDLSSNKLSDVSAINNIKEIATVNLHNQVVDKVEVIDNSIVKEGIYKYSCELPQIIKEFAKPIKPDWIDSTESEDKTLKFDVGSFNSNSDAIDLTIGTESGDQYGGLVTLKIKIKDNTNKLANSEINVHYVVIEENERAIYLKDKKLYNAVEEELRNPQLYNEKYDDQQILVISIDNLVNEITELELSQKQLSDLSGLEMFVGLEKSLDLSSNYIKDIDTIVDLQEMKDTEEAKLQERFKEKAGQLKEKIELLERLKTELETVVKTYNEAAEKYIEYKKLDAEDTTKVDKMLEQLKVLEAQGERYAELTGDNSKKIADASNTSTTVTKITSTTISGGEIKEAQEDVNKKETELYNIYNQVYKLTSVITPELKNITDDEYKNLTLEQAKTLLQAQATKMGSIEKYFTSSEKTYLETNFNGVTFDDEDKNKTPVATYYTKLLKNLEEAKNIKLYKDELMKLRKFDAYVMYYSSCNIGRWYRNDAENIPENYQKDVKELDGEDMEYMEISDTTLSRWNRGCALFLLKNCRLF